MASRAQSYLVFVCKGKLMSRLLAMFLLSLGLLGCSQASAEIAKENIIESFAASGISGEEQEKFYGILGAIDGFGIKGDDFSVELYKFKSSELAENCGMCEFTNENWGMMVHKKDRYSKETQSRIIEIFDGL